MVILAITTAVSTSDIITIGIISLRPEDVRRVSKDSGLIAMVEESLQGVRRTHRRT